MKTAMISQPMGGLSEQKIIHIKERAEEKLKDMGYCVLNTWFGFDAEYDANTPLYLLGRSIQYMAQCDAVYFCKGWEEKRGCRIEHEAAKEYGLELLYEEHHKTIFDVADWFLAQSSMTPKKLQKLCYYAEAWSEALLRREIVKDVQFEALVHGPVNSDLYKKYHDYGWSEIPKNLSLNDEMFDSEERELLESVWTTYGDMTGTELESLTCSEDPWMNQRKGLTVFETSHNIIRKEDMHTFYNSIYCGDSKKIETPSDLFAEYNGPSYRELFENEMKDWENMELVGNEVIQQGDK